MKITGFTLGSILLVAVLAPASMAQNNRTFVSGAGSDSNPCSLTAPCRTFTQAISQTNAGGEVVVLTSAGYGPFLINKAITVEAPGGVYAGITATSTDGIDINAGATDTVILRGLTINSQHSATSGIVFNTGGTLYIESCVVNGFSGGDGIGVFAPGNIIVKDTIARGNFNGIEVFIRATGTANVTMDQLRLDASNQAGLLLEAAASGAVVDAAIRNSSASGNLGGLVVDAEASGVALLDIESCLITNNGTGVTAEAETSGTGAESISNCIITNNPAHGFVVSASSGTAHINSRGNNTFIGNGPNLGSLVPLTAQ
jgi:hypothetical protein